MDVIRVRENSSLSSAVKDTKQANSGFKVIKSQIQNTVNEYTTLGNSKRSRDRI